MYDTCNLALWNKKEIQKRLQSSVRHAYYSRRSTLCVLCPSMSIGWLAMVLRHTAEWLVGCLLSAPLHYPRHAAWETDQFGDCLQEGVARAEMEQFCAGIWNRSTSKIKRKTKKQRKKREFIEAYQARHRKHHT